MLVSAVGLNQNSWVNFASSAGAMRRKLEEAGVRVPKGANKYTLRKLRDRLPVDEYTGAARIARAEAERQAAAQRQAAAASRSSKPKTSPAAYFIKQSASTSGRLMMMGLDPFSALALGTATGAIKTAIKY